MKAEKIKIESIEARAIELKVQVFEAERARARKSWKENALKAELAEAEERERRDDIDGEDTSSLWGRSYGR